MNHDEFRPFDLSAINIIRGLAIDAVQKANSGHPGLPLGAAPMAYVLWQKHLRHNPSNPRWPDRDRFVLSAGHGSMLLYALLYLTGYDLSLDDLKRFRQWDSKTPGHPEYHLTPGVEATTGPLGQGVGNAVGMAIAERFLAHTYNRPGYEIVNHFTYALVSDGDLMEGVAAEAASLAGHLRLGKLILLYDSNDVTLDGPASLSFSEQVLARFAAYGWHSQRVEDGNTNLQAIHEAIAEAKAETSRPSIIEIKTTLGYGSPKANSAKVHGAPLGEKETAETKKNLGLDPEKSFYVTEEVLAWMREAQKRGAAWEAEWQEKFQTWARAFPDLARQWEAAFPLSLPGGWDQDLPTFAPGEKLATREASGKVINALASRLPWLLGGDADLGSSTKTLLTGAASFDGQSGAGRNIHFGVREHAMAAILNGMAYHGGVRPYGSTFLVFVDYMRPAVRLAAMNRLPVIYVWTHDSIAVGEDGPTHQPVEQIMSLRLIPGLTVIRPADANETVEAWRWIAENPAGPAALILSRQGIPTLDRKELAPATGLRRGAYVLAEAEGGPAEAVIIATGSEVGAALAAKKILAEEGIRVRVVSMPSWELFAGQDEAYKESVLPSSLSARVAVEAGVTLGWERWVGSRGVIIGLDRFGRSAPGSENLKRFGFTPENIAAAVKKLLEK